MKTLLMTVRALPFLAPRQYRPSPARPSSHLLETDGAWRASSGSLAGRKAGVRIPGPVGTVLQYEIHYSEGMRPSSSTSSAILHTLFTKAQPITYHIKKTTHVDYQGTTASTRCNTGRTGCSRGSVTKQSPRRRSVRMDGNVLSSPNLIPHRPGRKGASTAFFRRLRSTLPLLQCHSAGVATRRDGSHKQACVTLPSFRERGAHVAPKTRTRICVPSATPLARGRLRRSSSFRNSSKPRNTPRNAY